MKIRLKKHMTAPIGYDDYDSDKIQILRNLNSMIIMGNRKKGYVLYRGHIKNNLRWMIDDGFISDKAYGYSIKGHFIYQKMIDYINYTYWLEREFNLI